MKKWTEKTEQQEWYKLDNAAKLYPAVKKLKWSSIFRATVILKEPVDPKLLQRALEQTLPRFPMFQFTIRKGMFWYYFEPNQGVPQVVKDAANPCLPLNPKYNQGFLFRIRYYHCKIALEVFHALTDGTGGLAFLKTLTAVYLRLQGHAIPNGNGIYDVTKPPPREEMEDGFLRFSTKTKPIQSRKQARAYHMGDKVDEPFELKIITGLVPVKALLEESRMRKVSITEFLAGVQIYSLYQLQNREVKRKKFPIKVSVPINLRNFYPTKTLRNFSAFVNPGIDPNLGEYTLDEIIQLVHHFMRYEVNQKFLTDWINKNVSSETNPVIRVIPLYLKNKGIGLVYKFAGESRFSSTFSNVGSVTVPAEMEPFIDYFEIMLGATMINGSQAAALSYRDQMVITFTRNMEDPKLERAYFRTLIQLGIPVKIYSNNSYDRNTESEPEGAEG